MFHLIVKSNILSNLEVNANFAGSLFMFKHHFKKEKFSISIFDIMEIKLWNAN